MKNSYFDFYLGNYPEDDFKISDCGMSYQRIVIFESDPPQAQTAFEIDILRDSFISCQKSLGSEFWRYAFFIKNCAAKDMRDSVKTLIFKCAEQGDVFEEFHEYVSFPFDQGDWESPELATELIPTCMPTMTWSFEHTPVEEGATMYDERIVVIISWHWEDKEYSFKCYWYVTSVAFIIQRLETIDPYYRRFVLLSHAFEVEHLKKQLAEELDYVSTIHPTMRELCLKHHFEYDGQSMFYER